MAMHYARTEIDDADIPRAGVPFAQHMLDTYASESNKTASVWRELGDADLGYRPHPRASTVLEIMKHQLLSERRFFGEFLGCPEPPADSVLPPTLDRESLSRRLIELARPRLNVLAAASERWWLERVTFFDVDRQRVWIFWRRLLHSAHHRTQLGVYLRLMDRSVPATYGPTADVTWRGADPTTTAEAAARP